MARAIRAAKPVPTKGPAKPVECRYCGGTVLAMFLRKHLSECGSVPQIHSGEKICTKCQGIRPIEEFSKQQRTSDHKGFQCKPCTQARAMAWYSEPENREHLQYRVREKLYGITREQYDALAEKQGGRCASCRKPPSGMPRQKHLYVDHSHKTGEVRGLLCAKCNAGMGAFDDDIGLLMKAIDYLRLHHPVAVVS